MKEFMVFANTQRKYILNGGTIKASTEDEAKVYIYSYIMKHKKELGYNDNLYLRIQLKEIR